MGNTEVVGFDISIGLRFQRVFSLNRLCINLNGNGLKL